MSVNSASGQQENNQLWHFPWSYRESFLIALEILLLSLIIEVLSRGQGIAKLAFPLNIFIGLALIAIIIIIGTQFRRQAVVRWLSSIPAAVSSISLFAFLVLLQGFIPQNHPAKPGLLTLLGLDHIKNSWIFALSGIYLLISLGSVILRKSIPFRKKNLPFLLNHLGLWIAIAAGSLGSGDLMKLNIYLQEGGSFTSFAYAGDNTAHTLPFSIRLTDFNIDNFPPDLVLVDAVTNTITDGNMLPLTEASSGKMQVFRDWQVTINEFINNAFYIEDNYIRKDSSGAAPAVRISALNKKSGQVTAGWVSCGSTRVQNSILQLGADYFIAMTFPEVQKYSSEVIIRRAGVETDTTEIEVNRPYRISGWRLYQMSYDEEKGKWSEYSILEAVNDPWLPAVYLGIFLMICGAVYLFWTGSGTKIK